MTEKATWRTPGILALIVIGLLILGGCSPSSTAPPAPPIPSIHVLNPTETRPDGATRLTIPPGTASDQNPAFSPDGTQLVFTRFDEGYNDGPASLFLLDISGGAATRLTPVEDQDNVNLPGVAWNEINDRIIFASDRQEADDLWRIAPDGSDLTRITTHPTPTIYIEPAWSPDGQWIVFEASQPGGGEDGRSGQVWKVRADGTALTQLTDGTYDDRQPNWSPAGDRILFQRRTLPSGQWDICTIAPDGSDLQNVTGNSAADETDASWSPGGTCIVYSSDNITLPVPNIFALPVAGGRPIRVTFSDANEDSAPSWSPDGQWITFESHESADENSPSALWRIAVPEEVCDEGFHVYLPITLTSAPSPRLLAVKDFLYQLQNLDLAAIGDAAYDLVKGESNE